MQAWGPAVNPYPPPAMIRWFPVLSYGESHSAVCVCVCVCVIGTEGLLIHQEAGSLGSRRVQQTRSMGREGEKKEEETKNLNPLRNKNQREVKAHWKIKYVDYLR